MTDAWRAFRDFVARTEDLPVSLLVRRGCATDPGDAVAAAYDAPFPTPASKAGARAFPLMLPTDPSMPGAAAGQRTLDALRDDPRPKHFLQEDAGAAIGARIARWLGEGGWDRFSSAR